MTSSIMIDPNSNVLEHFLDWQDVVLKYLEYFVKLAMGNLSLVVLEEW